MTDYKIGDKVKIINPEHENYGCITTIFSISQPGSMMTPWVGVEGGLKDESDNAPELTEIELYVEEEKPVEKPKLTVKCTKTIQLKENGITLSHVVGSKKQKVSISTKSGTSSIRLEQLDDVIALLQKMQTAVEVA